MHLIRVPSNTQCIHMHKLLLILVNIDNIFYRKFGAKFFCDFFLFSFIRCFFWRLHQNPRLLKFTRVFKVFSSTLVLFTHLFFFAQLSRRFLSFCFLSLKKKITRTQIYDVRMRTCSSIGHF